MRFLMTSRTTDTTQEPDATLFAEMGKYIEELTAAGILLATGGLQAGGLRMTSTGGEITLTDGPFTETKEAIVGFALIEVRSKEEAVEIGRRFLRIAGDSTSVIQEVFGP
jgi:hypothetical protein